MGKQRQRLNEILYDRNNEKKKTKKKGEHKRKFILIISNFLIKWN